jgi:hypothetical protein
MRRHRRRQAVGAATAALVLVGLLLPVTSTLDAESARPADTGPAIPSAVQRPWPRQAQVTDAPAGAAALIATGYGGSDVFENFEGRTLAVSRDGRYRLVDGLVEVEAGDGAHLSPDGRLLAVAGAVEGAEDIPYGETAVIDLATGRVSRAGGGRPLGWAPNSRHLLLYDPDGHQTSRYDATTGSSWELGRLAGTIPVPPYVTFTPDAFHFVVSTGSGEVEYDERDSTALSRGFYAPEFRYRLAGPAAVNPDGLRAYWQTVSGCNPSCATFTEPIGEFRLVFGNPGALPSFGVSDFDRVTGWMPRLLGWLPDGSAVVEVREPVVVPVGRPRTGPPGRTHVVALKPGGGRTPLVDLPADAHHVDLARDLVADGRFGADPPSATARAADWVRGLLAPLLAVLGAAVAAVGVALWLRRRRRRVRRRSWTAAPG